MLDKLLTWNCVLEMLWSFCRCTTILLISFDISEVWTYGTFSTMDVAIQNVDLEKNKTFLIGEETMGHTFLVEIWQNMVRPLGVKKGDFGGHYGISSEIGWECPEILAKNRSREVRGQGLVSPLNFVFLWDRFYRTHLGPTQIICFATTVYHVEIRVLGRAATLNYAQRTLKRKKTVFICLPDEISRRSHPNNNGVGMGSQKCNISRLYQFYVKGTLTI